MRLRNVKNANDILNNSKYFIKEYDGKYFSNNNDLHLEIGMGKGNFIIDMAMKHPDINFIGVEKYESVACRAIEKLDKLELDNVKIMCLDAMELNKVFNKCINVIYLNFSDPWPKKRHAKRRLTSDLFLKVYDELFKDECVIIQKTDNINLFISSIISLTKYGYEIVDYNTDLANSGYENSLTEYESKFIQNGCKINYLKAVKK